MKRLLLTTAAATAFAGAAQAEGSLNIFAWSDSIAPGLIEKFEQENDVDVTVDSFNSNEDLLTRLQAGASGYDLITPSQHFLKIMMDEGLLEDIDAHDLAAYQQVQDEWKGQWWDPENDFSIPLAYGTAGFTVNRDVYDGPVDSWAVYFEPPKELQGNIASLNYPDEVIGAAQLYLGVEFCTEDPDEMKKVYDLLVAQKPDVAVYASDNIENRIGSGEVGAHFWWDGNSFRTRYNDDAPIEYAMPKEGLVGWIDSMAVPAGASNVENAKAFMNFISTPENATIQYNYYAHSSPVELDLEQAEYTPENAPELFPDVPVEFSRACSPAAQDLVTRVWTQLLQ
ncbi:spermidine/putrescine transport system substrate-binding protein [Palleronia marisminoris]|uniref:Putrescine-binding periplasmic protein n=1 Tax=Palleronia marisminoris TaxID=315423 RepID=A0A1Y5RMK5_9RHOB|nr:extracellular solute-binding protein [Palleronia marisminoris]SFG28206.1 spermidine/putrescine transport system substrate-binding protein [Palleronia marisminoris]SLN20982.1 Spermidine/putrescine-binding periplasmic protein precursor [Palleronia marisminoris]